MLWRESNSLAIYHIHREINTLSQGTLSVTQYYSKLRRLWDDLTCLAPLPTCTCGATKTVAQFFESQKVMHFLMGMNEEYNHSKDQILLMDYLPSVNKVYSLVLKIEKQRMVNIVNIDNTDITTLLAKSHIIGNRNGRFET